MSRLDDVISRQTAINALIQEVRAVDGYYCESDEVITKDDALEAIKLLPSALPEIIQCRDCKYVEVADLEDGQDGYTCQFHRGSIWFSGSYCSWAERREE